MLHLIPSYLFFLYYLSSTDMFLGKSFLGFVNGNFMLGAGGIRLDAGNGFTGAYVSPHYDSLLVKVTSFARTLRGAARKGLRALAETLLRAAAIVGLAVGLTSLLVGQITIVQRSAWLVLLVGGGVYGVLILSCARWMGDAPLRAGIDGLLTRFRRR